jgi:hypothetical protein
MPETDTLRSIARSLFWWQSPEVALANPRRFLAQVMTLGTWDEVKRVEAAMGRDAFKDALLHAPPGVFDPRSWFYWRAVFALPEAELPHRSLT